MKTIKFLILIVLIAVAWGCKTVKQSEVDAAKKYYDPEVYREFVYVYPDIEPTASAVFHNDSLNYGYIHVIEMYPNTWYPVTSDTLLVYLQHQTENNTNFIYPLAKDADIVIMCFPENSNYLKHVILNSSGIIFIGEYIGGGRFIVFAENSLDKLPFRLNASRKSAIHILINRGRLNSSSG